MQVSILEWKSVTRNSLRGFATIRLGKSLRIKDVAVHCSHGNRLASRPSKPMIVGEVIQKDERGKVKYVPLIEWLDRTVADDFSESVIAAVEAGYPGQTQGDFAGG